MKHAVDFDFEATSIIFADECGTDRPTHNYTNPNRKPL